MEGQGLGSSVVCLSRFRDQCVGLQFGASLRNVENCLSYNFLLKKCSQAWVTAVTVLEIVNLFGGFSLPDLASTRIFLRSGGVESFRRSYAATCPDPVPARNVLLNGGVESFWGALCAEIGPSQRQVVNKICKKRLSEASRCQI